jgi:hypothetical protein
MTDRLHRELARDDVKMARFHIAEAARWLGRAHQTLAHPDVPEEIATSIGFRLEACQRELAAVRDVIATDQAMLQVPWLQAEGRS